MKCSRFRIELETCFVEGMDDLADRVTSSCSDDDASVTMRGARMPSAEVGKTVAHEDRVTLVAGILEIDERGGGKDTVVCAVLK